MVGDFLGFKYAPGHTVLYSFEPDHGIAIDAGKTGTRDLDGATAQEDARDAMDEWSSVCGIQFAEAESWESADVGFAFDSGDGVGGVLGWCAYWDVDGDGVMEGADGEKSLIGIDESDSGGFYQTALHEIGHAIGIGHLDASASVMSTYQGPGVTSLRALDIGAAQALYGESSNPVHVMRGTRGDDFIWGRLYEDEEFRLKEGNDTVRGNGGDDIIYGNSGNDVLSGNSGDDTIYGGSDDDIIYGNTGSDVIAGNRGNDILYGGEGDDIIFGGAGSDVAYGGSGHDTVIVMSAPVHVDASNIVSEDGSRVELIGVEGVRYGAMEWVF